MSHFVLRSFALLNLLWCTFASFGQTYSNAIGTPFRNEAGHVLHRSAAGDTYIGGSVGDSAVVMQLDVNGGVVWSRAFRTAGQYPKMVLHITDAPDGTLIGCGSGIMGNQELAEGFYFRFDAAGNFFWVRSWEDPTIYARRIVVSDPTSYVVFGGIENVTAPTYRDLVNAYVDAATGDLIGFTDRMDLYDALPYFDEIRGVAQINQRNYGVSSFSTGAAALSGRRIMLTTFDEFGQLIDTRYLVFPDNVDRRIYPSDIVAKDDSLTIAYYGDINGSSTNWSVGLIRCDTLGNIAWARDFNLAGSGQEHSTRVLATASGYLLAGRTMTTVPNKLFLMSISDSGVGQWYKSYGGIFQEQSLVENYAYNIADMGNGYLLTGYTNQTGDRDIFLVRTNEEGEIFCDEFTVRSAITTVLPTFNFPATAQLLPFVANQETAQPVVGDAEVLDSCVVNVTLGNDTALCGTLDLDATTLNATYLWSDGSTDATFTATISGTYWVQVTVACCIGSDTIVVDLGVTANIDLGPDTALCPLEELVLQPATGAWTLTWQDGTTDPEYIVYEPGTYWVDASDGPCVVTDTIVVSALQLPTLNFGNDTVSCNGSGVLLDPGATDVEDYVWSDGSTGSTLQVDSTLSVSLTVSNQCGSAFDDIEVTIIAPITVDIGPDTTLCAGNDYTLTADVPAGWDWAWSNGLADPTFTITGPGTYWLDVGQAGCILTDSLIVEGLAPPLIDLGTDTVVCDGGDLLLAPVLVDVDEVLWSDASTGDEFTATTSGIYSITVTNICGSTSDAIDVTLVDPVAISLGADTVLCAGDSLVIDLSATGATVTWSDGSQASSYIVDVPGTIYADVVLSGCIASDTLVVGYDTLQVVDLGPDTVLCAVFDYTLDAGDDNARWQDGSVGSTYNATRTDWYIAAVTSYCGTAVDSARVSFEVPTVPLEDIALCPGTKVELDPQGELIQTLWSNGDSTRTITVGEGDYSYEAIDIYGCPHSDSVEVRIFSRSDGVVYVPNAFTPNKDGLNDGFFVQGPEAGDFELLIHDRWGREVYSTVDPYKAWDGSSGGQEAPQDVYIYTVSYLDRCNANGTMVSVRGHVTLLR